MFQNLTPNVQNTAQQAVAPTMRVKKCLLVESGTYGEQYRRPYQSNMTPQNIHVLQERIDQANGQITQNLFSGLGQFLVPSAVPEAQINIANGWGTRKMRMLIEVEISNRNTTFSEVLLCWSEYNGVTPSGAIDENMLFHVNSVLKFRRSYRQTPLGMQYLMQPAGSGHILTNPNWGGIEANSQMTMMRPKDIYSAMMISDLPDMSAVNYRDTRCLLMDAPAVSRRSNNVSSAYATSILSGYMQAAVNQELGQGETETLGNAITYQLEPSLGDDQVIQALMSFQGLLGGSTFTWRDLRRLDPNIDNPQITKAVVRGNSQQIHDQHQVGQSQDWGVPTIEAQISAMLSQSIPSLIMDLGIVRLAFSATNRIPMMSLGTGSQHSIVVAQAESFAGDDLTMELQMFRSRLEMDVLQEVSMNGVVDYEIQMQVNLTGETRIDISVGGQPPQPFVCPTFTDALLVPVVTQNNLLVSNLALDFQNLLGEVSRPSYSGVANSFTTL